MSANTQSGEEKQLSGFALYATIALSLGFAIALFFVTPALVARCCESRFGWSLWWGNVCRRRDPSVAFRRLSVRRGLMPNIRRVFAYHGAEHQTINAFEAGAELTPENVATVSPRAHALRNFLPAHAGSVVDLLFSLLGPMPWYERLLSRVAMMPVLAGVAYEYTRWTAAHLSSPLVRWLIRPNLALQRLTTRRPSADMLEVAIAAFEAMRADERQAAPV